MKRWYCIKCDPEGMTFYYNENDPGYWNKDPSVRTLYTSKKAAQAVVDRITFDNCGYNSSVLNRRNKYCARVEVAK